MVYFSNSQHITLCQTYFLHNQTRWATCFIRVLYHITGIARVDGVIHSTDPIFASVMSCVSPRVSYVSIPHVEHARQGYTPFKRRMSEVGRCPCSGLTHGCRFYSERYCSWTLSWVLAWKVRCVLWSSAGTLTSFRKSLSEHRLVLD
jgi:hypothetical protein